jgi:hypothetical protein
MISGRRDKHDLRIRETIFDDTVVFWAECASHRLREVMIANIDKIEEPGPQIARPITF